MDDGTWRRLALAAGLALVGVSLWYGTAGGGASGGLPDGSEGRSASAALEGVEEAGRTASRHPAAEGLAQVASVEIRVRGLVLGEDVPVPGAELGVRREIEGPPETSGGAPPSEEPERVDPDAEVFEARADGSGVVRLEGLRPGTWRAFARAPGFFAATEAFDVRAVGGAPLLWDLTLEAHASIEAHVIGPDGAPVEGAVARVALPSETRPPRAGLHPADRSLGDPATWISAADGRLRLGVVPVGAPFTLVVDHSDRGRFAERMTPLQPGEVRTLRAVLEPHTVLVGSVARAPSTGVAVAVECWHVGESVRGLVAEHKAPAAADRGFALRNLAPGRKRLVYTAISEAGVDVGTLDAVAPRGVETDVGEIPVRNSEVRVLVVTDEDRQPLGQATLSVIWLPDDLDAPSMPVALRVRPGREVALRGFEAGQLMLSARLLSERPPLSHPDYAGARTRIPFDGASAQVELVLERKSRAATGEIVVTAVPPAGVAPGDLAVRVYVLSGEALTGMAGRAVPGSRRFGFQRFEPGTYRLVAVANGFRSGEVTVQVEPGRVSSVTLDRWLPAAAIEGRVTHRGSPVPDARVELLTEIEGPRGPPPPLLEVRTDTSGAFRIEALPALPALRLRAVGAAGVSPARALLTDGAGSRSSVELELR